MQISSKVKYSINSETCRKLINYLTHIIGSDAQETYLEELLRDEGLRKWIKAYSILDNSEKIIIEILKNPNQLPKIDGLPVFFEKIAEGFKQCIRIGDKIMVNRLEKAANIKTERIDELIDPYLPSNTSLNIEVIFTIDEFNRGMARETEIFRSITGPRQEINYPGLAHEIHHVASFHWFRNNPKWVKWNDSNVFYKKLAAQLISYIVSEGISNHFITPESVSKGKDRNEERNIRVEKLSANFRGYLELIERIMLDSLRGNIKESEEKYHELTLDRTGSGIPAGHYISARMFSEIMKEHDTTIVEELVKNPWRFFEIYDTLEKKTHTFSKPFIEKMT